MGAEQTRVVDYDAKIDKQPRNAAIFFLVFGASLLIAIQLQVFITRDWTVSTTQPTDRNANADWGLIFLSGWLCGGLLHMIMYPGSKLGFIMTLVVSLIVLVFSVIADITSWGRYINCRDDTIPGDTDFCDQNYHGNDGFASVGWKNLILSTAILQLILVVWALSILILASVWYNKRKQGELFPPSLSNQVQFAPPPQSLLQQYYNQQQQTTNNQQQQQQQYAPIQAVPSSKSYYQQQPQSQRFAPPINPNYSLVQKYR